MELVTAEDYARVTGREAAVEPEQVLVYGQGINVSNTFYVGDPSSRG